MGKSVLLVLLNRGSVRRSSVPPASHARRTARLGLFRKLLDHRWWIGDAYVAVYMKERRAHIEQLANLLFEGSISHSSLKVG